MGYSRYISTVLNNNITRISIKDQDKEFLVNELLCQELFYGPFSIYNIHSRYKKINVSIAYKNVHQKVHKMISLGLLEETKGPYSVHAAKFYKVSLNGWVNLIAEGLLKADYIYEPAIKRYYNTNIIFKTFLQPFFELETLICLESTDVSNYLDNCCDHTIRCCIMLKRIVRDPSFPSFLKSLRQFSGIASTPTSYGIPRHNDESNFEKIMEPMDYSEIEKIGDAKKITNTFSRLWDLQLKSFLFQQVMEYAKDDKMQPVLSKDRKFVSSIRSLEDEFRENHNRLFALQQNV